MPLVAEIADNLKHVLDYSLSQGRRRLIHDQYVGIIGDGLGDFDHLPVRRAEIADFGFWIAIDLEALEQRLGHPPHFGVIDETQPVPRLAPAAQANRSGRFGTGRSASKT